MGNFAKTKKAQIIVSNKVRFVVAEEEEPEPCLSMANSDMEIRLSISFL